LAVRVAAVDKMHPLVAAARRGMIGLRKAVEAVAIQDMAVERKVAESSLVEVAAEESVEARTVPARAAACPVEGFAGQEAVARGRIVVAPVAARAAPDTAAPEQVAVSVAIPEQVEAAVLVEKERQRVETPAAVPARAAIDLVELAAGQWCDQPFELAVYLAEAALVPRYGPHWLERTGCPAGILAARRYALRQGDQEQQGLSLYRVFPLQEWSHCRAWMRRKKGRLLFLVEALRHI